MDMDTTPYELGLGEFSRLRFLHLPREQLQPFPTVLVGDVRGILVHYIKVQNYPSLRSAPLRPGSTGRGWVCCLCFLLLRLRVVVVVVVADKPFVRAVLGEASSVRHPVLQHGLRVPSCLVLPTPGPGARRGLQSAAF
jgi:hypothetical protein